MTSKTYRDENGYRVKFSVREEGIRVLFFVPGSNWAVESRDVDLACAAHLIDMCEHGNGGVSYAFETLL